MWVYVCVGVVCLNLGVVFCLVVVFGFVGLELGFLDVFLFSRYRNVCIRFSLGRSFGVMFRV